MHRHLRLLPVLLLTLTAPGVLGAQTSSAGLGVRYAVPQEALADTHERGWGITWGSIGNFDRLWVSLSGGYTRFGGSTVTTVDGDVTAEALNQAEILLGTGIRVGQLYVGAKAGYFFRDEDEWDVVPGVSLLFGPFLVTGEAKVLGDVRWWGIGVTRLSGG